MLSIFCGLVALSAVGAVPLGTDQVQDFYVAQKNAVYVTKARELPWMDSSTLPLALREYRHHARTLVVYHKDLQTITEIDSSALHGLFHVPDLTFESLLVSEGKLFQKFGPLRLFKVYPTDAYDWSVSVTAHPRHNRIFVAVAPTQKKPFEGATCIVTDITTKKDVHSAHRISEVYPSLEPLLTWVSDRTVLAFEYVALGSGGYYIDTKIDTRTPGWDAVHGASYFTFDGSDLTLYTPLPDGIHIHSEVSRNFAKSSLPPSIPVFSLSGPGAPILDSDLLSSKPSSAKLTNNLASSLN